MGQRKAAGTFPFSLNVHRAQRNRIAVAAGVRHYSDGISGKRLSADISGGHTDGAVPHSEYRVSSQADTIGIIIVKLMVSLRLYGDIRIIQGNR